jgi:hypothetical protein
VPVWVTPKWEGEWGGDPAQVLDAFETAHAVLLETDRQPRYTNIDMHWEHGHREERSVEAARQALLFAERPKRIDAVVGFGPENDEYVRVRAERFSDRSSVLDVTTHVREDLGFANRLVAAAKDKIEPPAPQPATVETDPPTAAIEPAATVAPLSAPEPLRVRASRRGPLAAPDERVGIVSWLDSHQGVLALVGILVAVAIGVATLLLT